MTKDEAFEAIIKTCGSMLPWQDTKVWFREILDQIDPPAQEFTVRELCELIENSKQYHSVTLFGDREWCIESINDHDDELVGDGIENLRLTLIVQQTPKTVMVELDLATAKCIAEYRDGELAKSCRNALNKLEQQS